MSWRCCKCLNVTMGYPPYGYCQECGNMEDFVNEDMEEEEE